ncbi:hypothetical protein GWG65_14990 [Bradyrhizobium sp. CSA207]|uniref:hypothetical protein n=1 Tax=Bradyrhizobium sp. CSA207 TaxID=2698826 RepID=UPI0023B1A301|nr:hypothetical protein [Bradyrhizobium sp. CSA207]MDE5442732.1 hypothetical protein [Bradyrhizobium sp. CSA207]
MIFDIPNICGFEQKRCTAPEARRAPLAMAEDFSDVIYAIEANNQPRFGRN